MNLILNVGLARNDGKPDNTILRTVTVLNQCGFILTNASIQQSTTEPTLVAEVEFRFTDWPRTVISARLYRVASLLAKDCIAAAQYFDSDIIGSLHGPNAAKCGLFNPRLFLRPSVDKEYA